LERNRARASSVDWLHRREGTRAWGTISNRASGRSGRGRRSASHETSARSAACADAGICARDVHLRDGDGGIEDGGDRGRWDGGAGRDAGGVGGGDGHSLGDRDGGARCGI